MQFEDTTLDYDYVYSKCNTVFYWIKVNDTMCSSSFSPPQLSIASSDDLPTTLLLDSQMAVY